MDQLPPPPNSSSLSLFSVLLHFFSPEASLILEFKQVGGEWDQSVIRVRHLEEQRFPGEQSELIGEIFGFRRRETLESCLKFSGQEFHFFWGWSSHSAILTTYSFHGKNCIQVRVNTFWLGAHGWWGLATGRFTTVTSGFIFIITSLFRFF